MKTNGEFKGTPAPWHLSIPTHVGKWAGFNTSQGKCYGIYATNDDLEAVAMVFKDELLFHSKQDHLSNATLIAAAPELLEALQLTQELLEHLINAIPTGKVRNAACDANIIAQAAINKALTPIKNNK